MEMDAIDFGFREALGLIFHLSSTLNSSDRELAGFSKKFHESSEIPYREILIQGLFVEATKSIHLLLFLSADGTQIYLFVLSTCVIRFKVSHGGKKYRGYRIFAYIRDVKRELRTLHHGQGLVDRARKAIFSDFKEPVFRLSTAQMRFSRRVINTARHLQREERNHRPSLFFTSVEWIPPVACLIT